VDTTDTKHDINPKVIVDSGRSTSVNRIEQRLMRDSNPVRVKLQPRVSVVGAGVSGSCSSSPNSVLNFGIESVNKRTTNRHDTSASVGEARDVLDACGSNCFRVATRCDLRNEVVRESRVSGVNARPHGNCSLDKAVLREDCLEIGGVEGTERDGGVAISGGSGGLDERRSDVASAQNESTDVSGNGTRNTAGGAALILACAVHSGRRKSEGV